MKLIQCDRCGSTKPEIALGSKVIIRTEISLSKFMSNECDLCEACQSELWDWLKVKNVRS